MLVFEDPLCHLQLVSSAGIWGGSPTTLTPPSNLFTAGNGHQGENGQGRRKQKCCHLPTSEVAYGLGFATGDRRIPERVK